MRFDIITIFPEIINSYINESILKRAQAKKIIKIKVHNPRFYTKDKHKSVDDRPYGGGPGMILMCLPFYKTLKSIKRQKKSRIVMLDPGGKQFTQREAERLVKYDQLILLSGRYEGFDARLENFIDEKISIGSYVLAGGELPALVMLETICRLVPGVLGHEESNQDETFASSLDYIEYPQYTRPEVLKIQGKKLTVPKILLTGDHEKIKAWRKSQSKKSDS